MSIHTLVQIGGGSPPERTWRERLQSLRALIAGHGSVVVAYSGGVDSSLVLRVAHEVLGERALGVIGRSDSYATRELELALAQARTFGARVEVVPTGELADPAFRSNPADRCYHCKGELYRRLEEVANREGAAAILDGTIADDLTDWRPGRRAAAERNVLSPLAELGFTKGEVRAAARELGLAAHDKPASPCLASRIPYGTEITRENLSQVERGEELLRSLGFHELRLRHHGETARIEVPLADLALLLASPSRERVVEGLRAIGFRFVAVDLEGFRSGSLNSVLRAEPGAGEKEGDGSGVAQETGNRSLRGGDISRAPHGGGGTESDLR
jgi:uncharacterized protein